MQKRNIGYFTLYIHLRQKQWLRSDLFELSHCSKNASYFPPLPPSVLCALETDLCVLPLSNVPKLEEVSEAASNCSSPPPGEGYIEVCYLGSLSHLNP
uniref:Uncharacterized protein n=1 Tax=Anguilla anguilla TaxID=7936 RepID=A0A0E9RA40_ANGAN